jgi:hypothetical protein
MLLCLFYECYFTETITLVLFFLFTLLSLQILWLNYSHTILYVSVMKIYFFFLLLCFVPNFYFCFLISEKCISSLWRMQKQLNTMPKQTNYFQQKTWVSQSFFHKCFLLFMTLQKSSVFVNGIYSYFWNFLNENNLQMKSFS